MTNANQSPEKVSYLLVVVRHGDPLAPTFERYTDFASDVEGHVSTPAMEVQIPDNNGTFDKTELKMMLPLDDFTADASSGLPHSPMFLQVDEVTLPQFIGQSGSRRILYKGRVVRTIRNYQGRGNSVAFFALPAKARLDVPMGMQCNHHCYARLFSPLCGLNISSHQVFGEIAAMDGKEITISANASITAPTSPGGNVDRFWERGYLEKDGLQIGVHIWVLTDPTVFVLRRRPPNSWLLAGPTSIKFVPGCHKTIQDCRDVWDNEEGQGPTIGGGFAGYGYAMLPYNPLFENPA
jgi:hypothetical protein